MKNRAVTMGIIAGILPHLFCCVLPVVLGIIGMVAPEMISDIEIIPEHAEIWVFIFSGLMLILSWVMLYYHKKCNCDHCDATHHHRIQRIILTVITILTVAGITMHIISEHL